MLCCARYHDVVLWGWTRRRVWDEAFALVFTVEIKLTGINIGGGSALSTTAQIYSPPTNFAKGSCVVNLKLNLSICLSLPVLKSRPQVHRQRNELPGSIFLKPSINTRQKIEQWQYLLIWGEPINDPRWASPFICGIIYPSRSSSDIIPWELHDGYDKLF